MFITKLIIDIILADGTDFGVFRC